MSAGAPWLVCWPETVAAEIDLVCVGHAGAGAAPFQQWREWVPQVVGLCAFRFPGRESRFAEPPLDDLGALVAAAADAVEERGPRKLTLFGHCSGALVAYELADELRRRGFPPLAGLVVADQVSPRHVSDHPDTAVERDVWERVKKFGAPGSSAAQSEVLRRIVEPALRADLKLMDDYRPASRPPFDYPIVAYVPARTPWDARAFERWGEETRAGFEVVTFDGSHFLDGDAWKKLARAVGGWVATMAGSGRPPTD